MSHHFIEVVLGYDSLPLHEEAAHSCRLPHDLGRPPHVFAFLAFLSYYRFLVLRNALLTSHFHESPHFKRSDP